MSEPAKLSKLLIDGIEVEVPPEYTLLQACEGGRRRNPALLLPRTAFDRRQLPHVSRRGQGRPAKPVASCAMAVRDLRPGPKGEPPVVFTNSPMVKKARHGVMEFLLINHPLDCPICDQGGECDLQDQAVAFGFSGSRYAENKRAVEGQIYRPAGADLDEPLHSLHALRPLHGRKSPAPATWAPSAVARIWKSRPISKPRWVRNCREISRTSARSARCCRSLIRSRRGPWELTKTESVRCDGCIGLGDPVDTRGREVMRILPRLNDAVNEEWISDKTRQIVDGLKTRRLDRPYIPRERQAASGELAGGFRHHCGEGQSRAGRTHRRTGSAISPRRKRFSR